MELTDRSGYFAGPGMLGGSFGDASRASDEAAEGVADPCLGHAPDQVVFYELTRKFVETEEDVPQEACDVLYYTLAVGHHTGVLDCFEPRLSVPVDVFYSLVDALQEGEAVAARDLRCVARRARFSRVGQGRHFGVRRRLWPACPAGRVSDEVPRSG